MTERVWNPMSQQYDAPPSLVEFLLARIAEDEAQERALLAKSCGLIDAPTPEQSAWLGKSLRAQQIGGWVARRRFAVEFWRSFPWRWLGRSWLARLALPYADHPDYRDEWRP